MTSEFADLTVRDYVCAGCWGHLVKVKNGDEFDAECPRCGSGRGFTRKSTVNRRKSEDSADYAEARLNLRKALNLPTKSEEEIMRELGF